VRCDPAGCIGQLSGGRLVSFAQLAEAFAEDCVRAAVVISVRSVPGECAATLIDRGVWRAKGAMTLRWTGHRFEAAAARPAGYDRPWAHRVARSAAAAAGNLPRALDAAPQPADREADD
jgi:competence protein ComEC